MHPRASTLAIAALASVASLFLTLAAQATPVTFYTENLDTNPGWTITGPATRGWAYGQPTGGLCYRTTYDPTSGHTGNNVYGYNLAGPYAWITSAPDYLTTTPISTAGYTGVHLRFYRWLGVEGAGTATDHASIDVYDGQSWHNVWSNPPVGTITDSSWVFQDFDISTWADNKPAIQIRWGMGPTDQAVNYCGWNIDDISLAGDATNHSPTVTCPAPVVAECAGGRATPVLSAHVEDVDGNPLTVKWTIDGMLRQTDTVLSGGSATAADVQYNQSFGMGLHQVVVSVGDGIVSSVSCSTTVTVQDTQAPTITLNGAATMTIECHANFSDPGAMASDACAGFVAPVASGRVDTNTPGQYILTYTATDPSGNAGTAIRTVNIVDTRAPVIALNGAATMTVECHTSFTDPGATANDVCAGSLTVAASGGVDVDTPGPYILTYTATDPSGNTGTATRTVNVTDTQPPVVALNDSATMTVECHTSFTDPGATATDVCAGPLTAATSDSVDVNVVGDYELTYTAIDPSGNIGTAKRTVKVTDTQAPVVTLTGAGSITLQYSDVFVDEGATASDSCAGDLPVTTTGSVDMTMLGTYTLTYTATDPSGNVGTATRTVEVVDRTVPSVNLFGSSSMTVECHAAFVDPGAAALDAYAGVLEVTTEGGVDVNTPGDYMLIYTAIDPSGNTGTATRTVTVKDTTAPVVTLNGAGTVTVECQVGFTDPGATAADACAGSLTVTASGSVDVTTPGDYTLTYTATDPSGNTGTATRTVTVKDTTAPVVTLNGAGTMTVECHGDFADPGATAGDGCSGSLPVTLSGTVDANTPGEYTLTYTAADASGNVGTASRIVTVADTTAPVVTLVGETVMTVECHADFTDPGVMATDACGGSLPVQVGGETVDPNSPGTYVVTYDAVDPAGNAAAQVTRTIIVQDTQPPALVGVPEDISVGCDAVPPPATVTATDGCDSKPNVTFDTQITAGQCPGNYTITRTWTATDASGNSASASQVITVADTTPPTLVGVPLDTTVQCEPASPPDVTATDTCDPAPKVEFDEQTVPLGAGHYMVVRTWTATDWCGNTASAAQTITVADTTPPTIACPPDVQTGHSGTANTVVDLGTPSTNDACGTVSVSNDAPADFPVGETIVTWTATDGEGNTAQCTQVVTITNLPPEAVATVTQLTDLYERATVRLDGSGSSDPDDAEADLTYQWTVDGTVVCNGTQATCQTIEVPFTYGSHAVVFRVTDPFGASDEVTKTITIDPAALSVLEVDRGRVRFDANPGVVRLYGEIGLPLGANFTEISPKAAASVALAGITVLPNSEISFRRCGPQGAHWTYDAYGPTAAIERFHIDWDGATYHFRQRNFPVELVSNMITTTQTLLELRLNLKPRQIQSPFTVDVGGKAQVCFGVNGQVLSSTVPFSVTRCGDRVLLTLPFPLEGTTTITFSGGLNKTIAVSDGLKASVGRYVLDVRFAPSLMPNGAWTTPRSMKLNVSVGDEGYAGEAVCCPDCVKLKGQRWTMKDCDED